MKQKKSKSFLFSLDVQFHIASQVKDLENLGILRTVLQCQTFFSYPSCGGLKIQFLDDGAWIFQEFLWCHENTWITCEAIFQGRYNNRCHNTSTDCVILPGPWFMNIL